MQEWFERERGIKPETLKAHGVKIEGNKAIFPYPNGEKTRIHMPEGGRKFFFTKDQAPELFTDLDAVSTPVMFLVEGETDAMRLYQELGTPRTSTVMGLSGIETWQDEFVKYFENAKHIFVILDNDEDYNVKARVEAAWKKIRHTLGPRVKRLKLPSGVKDLCEFFDTYDIESLRLIAESAPAAPFHYNSLDLQKDPPPVNWLVNDMLGVGDLSVMVGEPTIGKSWLSMVLACAVAGSRDNWLGHRVMQNGRVLYVDEENPEDLVYQRLFKLGLQKEHADNIRYLHMQGIRLDRYPENLLDEAYAFEPTLIVLDSLTRLHTGDENNAGAMAALFNDGINPLARETGAHTLVLHHVNKSESASSFARSRGSGDITASVDTGFDIRKAGGNKLHVIHFKSRRRVAGDVIQCEIVDTPAGGVDIMVNKAPPF